jgi:hypothetical protein
MPTGFFSISNVSQQFTIPTGEIFAHGKAESPHLVIPLSIALTPFRKGEMQPYATFDIIHLYAELSLTTTNFKAAQLSFPVSYYVFQPTPYTISLRFPLTKETLFYIEKYRQGSLSGSLLFNLQVAHHDNLTPAKDGNGFRQPVIRGFELAQGHGNFVIEQSLWVNKVLPNLGYNAGALIEMPAVSQLLPLEYSTAIQELNEARKYFDVGDYDKAVGHCRAALEPIRKGIPNVKNQIQGDSRFKWLKTHYSATFDFIDAITGTNSTISNKSHHTPSMGNFGRAEAETIIGTTYYIISYLGKVIPAQIPEAAPIT